MDRYQFNPFFRTELNIIGLELTKLILVLTVIGIAYHTTSLAVVDGIRAAFGSAGPDTLLSTPAVMQLASQRAAILVWMTIAIVIMTIVFSYIVTRLALSPVRNALESQKQFIGNVAHELRTPIAVIKTKSEVALMLPGVSSELKKTLKTTIEELDRTSEILNNFLSLSTSIRLERIEFVDVDLGGVIRHVTEQMQGLSRPKHLEIEVHLSERRTVLGNTVAIEQILTNLMKNAIFYTPRNGHILIRVEPVHPNYLELVVQDTGVGIPRKDLFHIFEPYYRGDAARTRSMNQNGLGLTIVSELVKMHNGKIKVRSAVKRGTTVTVLLPAGQQAFSAGDVAKRQYENASEIAVDFSHNHLNAI